MNFDIEITAFFEKQAKRLVKKYPSLKNELVDLIALLKENLTTGVHIGYDCYKIRIAIASKGKGKSGGAWVITHLQITQTKIYLLSIYDKSEKEDIGDKDLNDWIKELS